MQRDFLLPPGPTHGAVAKLFIRGADDIGTGRRRRTPASEIARAQGARRAGFRDHRIDAVRRADIGFDRSEEHTSELQSLMRISYAVFCLKKKTQIRNT